ncbi:CRISPR-associated protein Cmr2 [Thiothrix caldifontis]|uniref:CRISPR-associated protein Cmr2 n=1 Tax=Thiothrix caldifontis TaxID=525918 RepID=A0A1H4ELY3_9GAMM|nr:type III-B CRISPR-associated protein Cas10/Cmr2 [Thiothrix caldifontis]SEA85242.1 CRISPR-associated protein Cmr2 [Thiothrix caldifontis]
MSNNNLWKTKLAAWLHDPAEKALILLRDKTGHEWGTVKRLRDELGIDYGDMLKQADWYASAADRPQFPLEKDGKRYAAWTQVDFADKPVLKHPLTGTAFNLGKLDNIQPEHLKKVSEDHFRSLIIKGEGGTPDWKKTLLNYWRFGSDSPAPELNHLWQNLPADTRIPDHSIWAHLDIVSAFAGAMTADKDNTPSLLSVSFGPVQGFIAEARSTSDLWAGSHLLARIAWEGMKVVCEEFGADAVLFPNLRGVPLVDVWLYDQLKTDKDAKVRFEAMDWFKQKTDTNPLFAAALPNRFVALVPADQAKDIAERIERKVRMFVKELGDASLRRILKEIGLDETDDSPYCFTQLKAQLAGFPEVYWAAVPWSLAIKGKQADTTQLHPILSSFYEDSKKVGFLDSDAWKVLQKDIELDGAKFYTPNPGVLYPALYDLLDRVAAAAKSARPFEQLKQKGFRSSLNGEREWLTLDRDHLGWNAERRKKEGTLWTKLAAKRKSWVKGGEHLDALNAIKRVWPSLFAGEVEAIIGAKINRYVVSTHTLALAVTLDKLAEVIGNEPKILHKLAELSRKEDLLSQEAVALPLALNRKVSVNGNFEAIAKRLPSALDADEDGRLAAKLKNILGTAPEAYYGMILLDGDKMGAWVSGDEKTQIPYQDCWHPQIINSGDFKKLVDKNTSLKNYLQEKHQTSPARHRAISEALNQFSIKVARFVVEDCFKGKLIYSGGDDVLAFVCVDDLLPAMTMLRYLYSGKPVPAWIATKLDDRTSKRFDSKNGYLLLDGKLLLTMGEKAEASCGAVVAHHQAPLGYVLRQLRAAESKAKNAGGRNAFSLHVFKRAGGEISVTDKWERSDATDKNAPELLAKLMAMLARNDVSRRAAYHSLTWLKQLPPQPDPDMLKINLAHQFGKQGSKNDRDLAYELAAYVSDHCKENPAGVLENMLMVAEFLARETRHAQQEGVPA